MEKDVVLLPIPGFSQYKADVTNGRIWSDVSKKWLNPKGSKRYGYLMTTIKNNEDQYVRMYIHELIMSAVMGVTKDHWITKNLEINHINGDKKDNRFTNLQLTTRKGQYVDPNLRKKLGSTKRIGREMAAKIKEEFKNWEGKKSQFCNVWSAKLKVTYSSIENILNGKTYANV
jgi:HNH endonuclease